MGRFNSFVIKKLIEIGTGVGIYSRSMLSYCIRNKMVYEASILIDKGIGINEVDKNGDTPLHIAISEDVGVLAKMIIERGINLENANSYGSTPLHVAVNRGNISVVDMLIKRGVNVNAKDKFFRTPLHCAVTKNDVDILKLLIDNNAHVDARDLNGETPLYRAIKYGRDKVEELLLDNTKDINISNKYGCNLLHMAINRDNFNIVPKLISRRIYINQENIVGETPLVTAVTRGNVAMAKLLIENGADIDVMDNLERLELIDVSVRKGSKEMIMLLLKNGASITRNFVRWANKAQDMDILREINKRMAVDNNDIDMLKRAIQKEVFDNIKYDNRKLLEMAIRKGRKEISCILMRNLTNDKWTTVSELVWNERINDVISKSVFKEIRRNKNFYVRGLILDCIYDARAKKRVR